MIIQVPAFLISCDGCQRVLYEDRANWHCTVLTESRAVAQHTARLAGWTVHPDGRLYCPDGRHA